MDKIVIRQDDLHFPKTEEIHKIICNNLRQENNFDNLEIIVNINKKIGDTFNSRQSMLYTKIHHILQLICFSAKDLTDNLYRVNNREKHKSYLLATTCLFYTAILHEQLYVKSNKSNKNNHILNPQVHVDFKRLESVIDLITDNSIVPDVVSYRLATKYNMLSEYIKMVHDELCDVSNLYHRFTFSIPFTNKKRTFTFPRWKYRYITHSFKDKTPSPILLQVLKMDIDNNTGDIDIDFVFDKFIGNTLYKLLIDNDYLNSSEKEFIEEFIADMRDKLQKTYVGNKKANIVYSFS